MSATVSSLKYRFYWSLPLLSILSAGSAFPSQTLSNGDLGLTAPSRPLPFIAEKRGVTLPLTYINETGNLPVKNALPQAIYSPSDLGVKAVESAATKAGITVESIELLIGDTSTPWEVCPSEGQRVAGKLGRKIPSYDITASTCATSAQLSTLLKWKANKIPEYTALVSASAPTQVVNFREGDERFIFGDGASAFIVSSVHQKGWKVLQAHYSVNPENQSFLKSDLFAPISLGELPSTEVIENILSSFGRSLGNDLKKDVSIVTSPLFEEVLNSWFKKSFPNTSAKLLSVSRDRGDLFGANSGAAFVEYEGGYSSGSQILFLEVGPGVGVGAVLLEKW